MACCLNPVSLAMTSKSCWTLVSTPVPTFISRPPPLSAARPTRVDHVVDVHEVAASAIRHRRWSGARGRAACRRRSRPRRLRRAGSGAGRRRSPSASDVYSRPRTVAVVVEVVADGLLRHAVRRLRALRMSLPDRDLVGRAVERCPPDAANTTLVVPAASAPSHTLRVPRTFTVASNTGRATETRTSACAARWKTISGLRCAMRSITAGERDVDAMEREAAIWLRAARPAQVGQAAGREVVDDIDVAVLGEEPVDERRADEAGAAPVTIAFNTKEPLSLGGNATSVLGREPPGRTSECCVVIVASSPTMVLSVSRTLGLITLRLPTTEWSTVLSCSTRASSWSTADSSTAPCSTTAPAPSTEPRTCCPGLDADVPDRSARAPAPSRPVRSSRHPGSRYRPRSARGRQGVGGRPTAPSSTSAWASRYFSGVPMSSQC